jgi:hypothetical protein
LMIAPTVSIKYKNRADTYKVVRIHRKFRLSQMGNYLIYAPSHAYLAGWSSI